MRIVYIGRFGQNNADDEGAITHALRQLGCEVLCVPERDGRHAQFDIADLVLFNHWQHCEEIDHVKVPKAFWNFDLVSWPSDPTLEQRSAHRREWLKKATDICDFGFLTDGDHVVKDKTGKLHWLPQGADERILGHQHSQPVRDILFTGIAQGGGKDREEFVHDLTQRHGGVLHVPKGLYREALRWEIGRTRIVVAPDSPVTDNYFSNRCYNTLGFGGFLLHPYCKRLAEQYEDGKEIVFYNDREHMHNLIRWWLEDDGERLRIARAGLERTKAHHTYRRRCELLIAAVRG